MVSFPRHFLTTTLAISAMVGPHSACEMSDEFECEVVPIELNKA
jgi:hypothetical protein